MDDFPSGAPGEVLERFLRYVRIESASDPASPARPSTQGQTFLIETLADELDAMDGPWKLIRLSDGSLLVRVAPSEGRESSLRAVFLAHVDTYYGMSGAASPRVVECVGAEIPLAPGTSIPASVLEPYAGKRLVVTDGTSLLGADDKAGVAALMTVLATIAREDSPRGPVDFWFTTDEEIGRIGVDALPPGTGESWDVLWTLDGEELSDLSVGDLAIRRAQVAFTGVDAHPCLHGQDLVPAHYAAARFVDRLAELPNPMTSSGRSPFYQVASIDGRSDRAEVFCRLASFDDADLPNMERRLVRLAERAADNYGAKVRVSLSTGSVNFRKAVAARPYLIDPARRALEKRGFAPRDIEIRGGTDGGLLAVSFPDLAAPDLGNGARNPHSKAEFLVVDELLALPGVVLDIIADYSAQSK